MRKYVVDIKEVSIKTVVIEAKDKAEAEEIVSDLWNDSKIILYAESFDHADFEAVREANDADMQNFEEVIK